MFSFQLISCWILAPFLLEAVEASLCYYFWKTGGWNSNAQTPEIYKYLHHNRKVVFSWPPRSSKSVNMSWNTLSLLKEFAFIFSFQLNSFYKETKWFSKCKSSYKVVFVSSRNKKNVTKKIVVQRTLRPFYHILSWSNQQYLYVDLYLSVWFCNDKTETK